MPAKTDSEKTNESVQREGSELSVGQRSSYLKSRHIALKKFTLEVKTLAERLMGKCCNFTGVVE
jgi:hypothetical protein